MILCGPVRDASCFLPPEVDEWAFAFTLGIDNAHLSLLRILHKWNSFYLTRTLQGN
jgi:hypothetical protein